MLIVANKCKHVYTRQPITRRVFYRKTRDKMRVTADQSNAGCGFRNAEVESSSLFSSTSLRARESNDSPGLACFLLGRDVSPEWSAVDSMCPLRPRVSPADQSSPLIPRCHCTRFRWRSGNCPRSAVRRRRSSSRQDRMVAASYVLD